MCRGSRRGRDASEICASTFRISSVAAIAKTPSANVSSREVFNERASCSGLYSPAAPRTLSPKTSSSASIACGRTSSTPTGRPSSRAIVVNDASSSPQAVIHSVNGAGSRSTLSAYPCVVTHLDTWIPIEAIFRGRAVDPDPGQPFDPRRLHSQRRQSPDQRLLEVAAVALHILSVALQVEDRVADELPGAVVGRLAAAVGLDDLDLGALGHVQLALLGATAERDHRRMLEQHDRVRDRALRDRVRERALQLPRLPVRDEARLEEVGARAQ